MIDTHAHYEDVAFDVDREELLASLSSANVAWVVDVGSSMETTMAAVALSRSHSFVYAAAGVHPEDAASMTDQDIETMRDLVKDSTNRIVAIGEIGLDYHWPEPSHDVQQECFRKQLLLAKQLQMPVIIHSRDAAEDTLHILQETQAGEFGGVIHCFSYSVEQAKIYVAMGFYIGIGGVLTFKNAKKLKRIVQEISLDHLVLETDAPYMSPEPFRGQRNDSQRIQYVIEEIARLKEVSMEEVDRVTTRNAHALYRIPQ